MWKSTKFVENKVSGIVQLFEARTCFVLNGSEFERLVSDHNFAKGIIDSLVSDNWKINSR